MAKKKRYGEILDDEEISESERSEIVGGGQYMSGGGAMAHQIALSQARSERSNPPASIKQMKDAARSKLERASAKAAKPSTQVLSQPEKSVSPNPGRGLRALGSELAAETASVVGGNKPNYPTRGTISVVTDD